MQRIEAIQFETIPPPVGPNFTAGGPRAWLVTMLRV